MTNKDVKSKEIVAEPKKAYHEKQEPMRFKLKRARVAGIDESFKKIYKINN